MRQPKRSDDKYWTGTRIFHEEQFISDLQDHIDLLNERIYELSKPDNEDQGKESVCTICGEEPNPDFYKEGDNICIDCFNDMTE